MDAHKAVNTAFYTVSHKDLSKWEEAVKAAYEQQVRYLAVRIARMGAQIAELERRADRLEKALKALGGSYEDEARDS